MPILPLLLLLLLLLLQVILTGDYPLTSCLAGAHANPDDP
jgi:hypothetical protein